MTAEAQPRWRTWVILGLAFAVAVAGAVLLFRHAFAGSSNQASGVQTAAPEAEAPHLSPAGPARLRDGARQVSDPYAARRMAEEALARVDAELAAATEPTEIDRLRRKRELIKQAAKRLERE
jgi:hypothetical protein